MCLYGTAGAGNAPNAHNANLSRVEEMSLNKAERLVFTIPIFHGSLRKGPAVRQSVLCSVLLSRQQEEGFALLGKQARKPLILEKTPKVI